MFGPSKREMWRMVERERTQHRQEVSGLLDRLAALSGTPWTLPPRSVVDEKPLPPDPYAHFEEV